jgi:uncharacterized protein with PIN domain
VYWKGSHYERMREFIEAVKRDGTREIGEARV